MKLVHVVPHVDREASGPSYSVPRLCESLAARGHDVELSCLAARGEIPGVRLDVHAQWQIAARFAISPSHARALRRKAGEVDIVHNHSLWSMVNVAAGLAVPGNRAKLVTSPRGTLSRWALERRRFLKRALWPLQARALSRADLLHATSDAEYQEIRDLGLAKPVTVIPNGVDLPPFPAEPTATSRRTLLYLGRLHPKKGLDSLLEAWRNLQDHFPEWDLKIAGPGESEHVQAMHRLCGHLALRRVEFTGPVYGSDKSNAYFGASLFVLPTKSENFGMVVAEALAHGCPALVTHGAPWSRLEAEGCGWWTAGGVRELTAALDAAMSMSREALTRMGQRGRAWMRRDFSWASVAEQMELSYAWVLGRADRPPWLRLD